MSHRKDRSRPSSRGGQHTTFPHGTNRIHFSHRSSIRRLALFRRSNYASFMAGLKAVRQTISFALLVCKRPHESFSPFSAGSSCGKLQSVLGYLGHETGVLGITFVESVSQRVSKTDHQILLMQADRKALSKEGSGKRIFRLDVSNDAFSMVLYVSFKRSQCDFPTVRLGVFTSVSPIPARSSSVSACHSNLHHTECK